MSAPKNWSVLKKHLLAIMVEPEFDWALYVKSHQAGHLSWDGAEPGQCLAMVAASITDHLRLAK